MSSPVKITKSDLYYKIGVNEVDGLKPLMIKLMKPLKTALKKNLYWSDVNLHEAEYISRDGFIPHSHNAGGIEIFEVIPKSEEYDFGFLTFGDYDEEDEEHENDEGLEAALQIFFKFEGYDPETKKLSFYLVLSGGNNDAPYFRNIPTLFETEFTAKSLAEVKNKGELAIKKLIKFMSL